MTNPDPNAESKKIQESEARVATEKATQARSVNASTEKAQTVRDKKTSQSQSSGKSEQREVQCPFCASHVKKKDVTGGRSEIVIPFFDPPLRIPIPPFLAKMLKPDPEKCSCEGKQKVKDVSDDSAKYEEVKQYAEANIEKAIEVEAKMGTGGNRTTIIEKSETLMVGLGFNRNDSYEVIPEGHYAPSNLNSKDPENFGFAEGKAYNAVQGKQTSLLWPSAVGNYKIVCANSYELAAGAGGIKLETKGPLTINSGIVNFTGPQVNLGCADGPLTLEGDTVSIGGKTITMTPTDANVFVKGTISATGNIAVGGALHAETLSFSKASCPGKDKRTSTNAGNPDVTITSPAVWGGAAVKAIITGVLDIQTYFQNVVTNYETAATSVLSPTQMANLMNRCGTLAKSAISLETMITGICITAAGPGIVINFPHVHAIPSLVHDHGIRIPDIDCDNYSSPQALRAAVINESLTSNAASKKATGAQELLKFSMALPGSINSLVVNIQKLVAKLISFLSS